MNPITFFKVSLLKLISQSKIKSLPTSKHPKFLILMNQNIGDMIVFSPLIREIKKAYPYSSLQVISSENNIEIAKKNPNIDKVFLYQNRWNKLFPLLLNLRSVNFDYAIELEAKVITKVILMLKIISPNCILSVSKREGRYGLDPQSVLPYDYYTDENLNHQRDTCLDILRLLNIKVTDKTYDFFYLDEHAHKADSYISKFDDKDIIVALNIAGSSDKRKFCDNDVEEIIKGLKQISTRLKVVLIHQPKDFQKVNRFINSETSRFVFASYPTRSILDVAALIDKVDLVITPDTSLVHMACALNIPLLAIYANDMKTFEAWHPKSKLSHVIFSKYFDSLKHLNIESIIDESAELIKLYTQKDL